MFFYVRGLIVIEYDVIVFFWWSVCVCVVFWIREVFLLMSFKCFFFLFFDVKCNLDVILISLEWFSLVRVNYDLNNWLFLFISFVMWK